MTSTVLVFHGTRQKRERKQKEREKAFIKETGGLPKRCKPPPEAAGKNHGLYLEFDRGKVKGAGRMTW